jgi:hypothetical protein
MVVNLSGPSATLRDLCAFRQPEVQNLHVPVAQQHDVLGLQVPMNDSAVVRGSKSTRRLHRDVQTLTERQRTLSEPVSERLTVEQLGDHVGDA